MSMTIQDASPPTIRTYWVGDLCCHLCGRIAGSIESEQRMLPPMVRFTPVGGSGPTMLIDWRRQRCGRCGGALMVESMEQVRRRVEPFNPFESERPRRGRRPKWLIEQQQRERELSTQEAA